MSILESVITDLKEQPEKLQAVLFLLKKMEHSQKVKNNVKTIIEHMESTGIVIPPKFNPF